MVERHDKHFAQDTSDEVWITDVGRRGWIILTADARIRYNPLERDALLASQTHVFVLAGRKNKTGAAMAQHFISASDVILQAIHEIKPPAVFKVHENGRIEPCMPTQRSSPKAARNRRQRRR